MNGYRPMVMEILQRRFPNTDFTFTDAGIASTCSTSGAFRLREHVLSKGPVDLFFVEFAVNDDQDAAHAPRECVRGMEGVIRATRLENPNTDIVMTYFVNPSMLAKCQAGENPPSIAAHSKVAEQYNIPTINLAQEVADQIDAETLTWKVFGGTHPKPPGNQLCASMIDRLMEQAWSGPIAKKAVAHSMPKPLDEGSYFNGRWIDPKQARDLKNMTIKTPDWKSLKGKSRPRYEGLELLCGEQPGAEATLDFEGKTVGAFVLAGPDAATVEVSVDGGPFADVDLFRRFSKGLHYPHTVIFATDLEPGKHTLRLRVAEKSNEASTGHAMRVWNFVAN